LGLPWSTTSVLDAAVVLKPSTAIWSLHSLGIFALNEIRSR
jgi:hypothetical protein